MTTKERLKAAAAFVLAYLSTPSSKAGIATVVGAVLGNKLAPNVIEGIVQGVILVAGAALVAWPERPK